MRILLTNDDGYFSKGILLLKKELEKYGEVIISAPNNVQSGKSCSITITKPLEIAEIEKNIYSVSGTPVDCVIFGLSQLGKFDLVVSGCNNSPNMGVDTIYSGTLGACRQALIAGVPTISFSCHDEKCFSHIEKYTKQVMDFILKNNLLSEDYFINVNYPRGNVKYKGMKITKLYFQKVKYSTKDFIDDLFVSDRDMGDDVLDDTYDVGAFNLGYISLTPINKSSFSEDLYEQIVKNIK